MVNNQYSLQISDIDEPTRLDRYLKRQFSLLTQGMIESYLRKGKIKLNGKKTSSNIRVQFGDILDIDKAISAFALDIQDEEKQIFSPNMIALAEKLMGQYLLLETPYFIAIDKPNGLAVQGGSKISFSIDDAISYLSKQHNIEYKLVHRLDKDTSGLLLIAKGYGPASKLAKAFREHKIEKTYLALLSCFMQKKNGVIENYIETKDGLHYAYTTYKVIEHHGDFSFVEFKPKTGRMHQLRIHSKLLGGAIVGDRKYGGADYKRMLLHANEVLIPAETFGEEFHIKSKANFLKEYCMR